MYLKGYKIKVSGDNELTKNLHKWDFGGDKPWTNSIWSKEVEPLNLLDQSKYYLIKIVT